MKLKSVIAGIFLLEGILSVNAQTPMGNWRTHFAYNSVEQIAQSDNKIFGLSNGSLYSVDKDDESIELYSKINGLTDNDIYRIEYDTKNKQLLIVYSNGNIDLLSSGGVINIPDLYIKQLTSSKLVNDIVFFENKAYLACDFGILVLNLEKHEIADTYYIGNNGTEVQVLSIAINNGYIYAATSSLIYKASLAEKNLVDYQRWSTLTNLPGAGDIAELRSADGNLFLKRGTALYEQSENSETWMQLLSQISVSDIFISNDKIIVYDGSLTAYVINNDLSIKSLPNTGVVKDAEYQISGDKYWFASVANGIGLYLNNQIVYYKPSGPAVNIPWSLTFSGQKLFMVQGGRWGAEKRRDGILMIYEKGTWTNLPSSDISSKTGSPVLDFMNVAVDPTDNSHFFVTSYGTGLYEFKDDKYTNWYTNSNSTLETIVLSNPYRYIRLDGAVFDSEGNLFLTNMEVGKTIKVLPKDGEWSSLKYNDISLKMTLGKILLSNQNENQKWVLSVRAGAGVFVFDDNGTIDDQSDDQSIFLTAFKYPETDNGITVINSVTPTYVYSIAQDQNGVVWVGTDQGPFLFYNTSNVFDPDYTCTRVKIPRNDGTDLADYLLFEEKITAIVIDGANRKWLGTETSGVYLMSENGQETIHHFTTANSPLPSNNVLSLAINPETGEVYMGTANGLVSYQSDAVDAGDSFSDVHAYPNPVREDYSGVITITGLVTDTQVKITDINGNLICQTVSNGGIATWDGKDVHGNKVSTGIYLAICVNSDGTESTVTKILVIN
ncbi:MAG: two-component regulator propeller domain-containing protein [Paludibacter sp.]|nr:two-component regulator propeller domain-containing protein [Paludibacter sp.]